MFSHVVACGDDVWMPSTGSVPPDLVDERIRSDEDTQATMNDSSKFLGESSTSKRKKVRSRNGSGEGSKQLLISHVLNLIASRQAVPPPTRSVSIKEAFEELSRIPEIYDDLEFYDFATEFIRDKSSRESFMSCPPERKVWWLKRRFSKSE